MDNHSFRREVKKMRKAQIRFFKTRLDHDLNEAKRLETVIDAALLDQPTPVIPGLDGVTPAHTDERR